MQYMYIKPDKCQMSECYNYSPAVLHAGSVVSCIVPLRTLQSLRHLCRRVPARDDIESFRLKMILRYVHVSACIRTYACVHNSMHRSACCSVRHF